MSPFPPEKKIAALVCRHTNQKKNAGQKVTEEFVDHGFMLGALFAAS